jgi:hypothetical protein
MIDYKLDERRISKENSQKRQIHCLEDIDVILVDAQYIYKNCLSAVI